MNKTFNLNEVVLPPYLDIQTPLQIVGEINIYDENVYFPYTYIYEYGILT